MKLKEVLSECIQYSPLRLLGATVFQFSLGGMFAGSLQAQEKEKTRSPIKHVIIIVGENRTFDHLFATYKPKDGQFVDNLLSKGIVNADGTPGPNFSTLPPSSPPKTPTRTNTKSALKSREI